MSQTIEAIYENGTFKPLGPVDLPEGTRVRVEVELSAADGTQARVEVEPPTTDPDEWIRQQLLSEGASPESIDKALATLHQLDRCFEGLTEEQLRIMDEARLDQVNFFNRPED